MRIEVKETNPFAMGIIFSILGLASLVAMSVVIYNGIGSDDFFYVNETVEGVTQRAYRPGIVILLLTFWGLATAAFLFAGVKFLRFRMDRGLEDESLSNNSSGISTGVIFILIGLISAAIPIVLSLDGVLAELGTKKTVAAYLMCIPFALVFIVIGIYMVKKRYKGGIYNMDGEWFQGYQKSVSYYKEISINRRKETSDAAQQTEKIAQEGLDTEERIN